MDQGSLKSARGVYLCNLGCRVNHAEIEAFTVALRGAGFYPAAASEARWAIVNTCAVTAEAEAKSRKAIRRIARMPSLETVYVTGCAAALFSDEFRMLSKKVRLVSDKSKVVPVLLEEAATTAPISTAATAATAATVATTATVATAATVATTAPGDAAAVAAMRPGESALQTEGGATSPKARVAQIERARREIKIQEGCDAHCTYCIVRKARGKARSVALSSILEQVCRAEADGIGEVVLSGINLGKFRTQDTGTASLAKLMTEILHLTKRLRIRLSSIEPNDIDETLLQSMSAHPKRIASYLHVPLQAGADKTLLAMGRPYTTEMFRETRARIVSALPAVALATDVIVGFPGETREDFEESLRFIEEMGFAKVHLFRYSKRPGTPAAAMPNQVAPEEKARRMKEAAALAKTMREKAAQDLLGRTVRIFVEAPGRGKTEGLFEASVPQDVPLNSFYEAPVLRTEHDSVMVAG